MKLSELLREVGDENISFQVLNEDVSSAKERPAAGQITFGTAPGNVSAMMTGKKRAFVVWMDEEQVQAAATRLREAQASA